MTTPDEHDARGRQTGGGTDRPPVAAEHWPVPTTTPGRRFFDAGAPAALKPVAVLLVANLTLSIILTVLTAFTHNSIIEYQLDHRHITDPALRETLKDSYSYSIISRAVVNIALSVVYVFLLRALFRGRRWAYKRVILLSAAGIIGILTLLATPYPPWMRVEQALQALVLATLLYFVTRPAVRAHFDPDLPGRNLRRFNR
jgi:hypothetical protein